MEEVSFIYWLHGYFELSQRNSLSPTQVEIIKDHIRLVENKNYPSTYSPSTYSFTIGYIKGLLDGDTVNTVNKAIDKEVVIKIKDALKKLMVKATPDRKRETVGMGSGFFLESDFSVAGSETLPDACFPKGESSYNNPKSKNVVSC